MKEKKEGKFPGACVLGSGSLSLATIPSWVTSVGASLLSLRARGWGFLSLVRVRARQFPLSVLPQGNGRSWRQVCLATVDYLFSPILSFLLSSVRCGISRIPRVCWELVRFPWMVLLFWIVVLGSKGRGCDTSLYCHASRMPLATMENLTVLLSLTHFPQKMSNLNPSNLWVISPVAKSWQM